ncbi:MAG: glycosyltransferase [Lachnospiraceae bacterium]|nr:glycosyltransferase [Lachnospiraceae bacterium]
MSHKFSILIRTADTNGSFFRDALESVIAQTHTDLELVVLDETDSQEVRYICEEMFAGDERIIYRTLKNRQGIAYAYNIGVHFSSGDHVVIMGQHDRISADTLERFAVTIESAKESGEKADIIYTDHDELIGMNRMNPHFLPDYNEELIRHIPYISPLICFKRNLVLDIGEFNENLAYFPVYDFIFRGVEAKKRVLHLANLLYHERQKRPMDGRLRQMDAREIREYGVVVAAHLKRMGVDIDTEAENKNRFIRIDYRAASYKNHRDDFLFLRDNGVRALKKTYMQQMYDVLSQPDVGIVGVRFIRFDLTNDNCGYIYGTEGIAYPACYGEAVVRPGYDGRAMIPRDVSMVDAGFCLIDAKLYRHIGGFGSNLDGRDIMLDFCMKTREAGRRIVYLPEVTVLRSPGKTTSSQSSNSLLMERWHDALKAGDPYYNRNLPLGLSNYKLY